MSFGNDYDNCFICGLKVGLCDRNAIGLHIASKLKDGSIICTWVHNHCHKKVFGDVF